MPSCSSSAPRSLSPWSLSTCCRGEIGHCKLGEFFLCDAIWMGLRLLNLFVVPTMAFQRLYGFLCSWPSTAAVVVVCDDPNPTADWLHQIIENAPVGQRTEISH